MLRLRINKSRGFKVGEVVHLKIKKVNEPRPGWWELEADDVTPLPGYEPPAYACFMCSIVEPARGDGSLPEGWTTKKFEKGQHFVCPEEFCQSEHMCRVCGCTNEHGCEPPCWWVREDLCSACAPAEMIPDNPAVLP